MSVGGGGLFQGVASFEESFGGGVQKHVHLGIGIQRDGGGRKPPAVGWGEIGNVGWFVFDGCDAVEQEFNRGDIAFFEGVRPEGAEQGFFGLSASCVEGGGIGRGEGGVFIEPTVEGAGWDPHERGDARCFGDAESAEFQESGKVERVFGQKRASYSSKGKS